MKRIKLIMLTLILSMVVMSCGESEQERLMRESLERVEMLGKQADSTYKAYEEEQRKIELQGQIDEINAQHELEMVKIKNRE